MHIGQDSHIQVHPPHLYLPWRGVQGGHHCYTQVNLNLYWREVMHIGQNSHIQLYMYLYLC